MDGMPRTIAEAAVLLRERALSSVELTTAALERADDVDPLIGAYVDRFQEYALQQAEWADRKFAEGTDLGPLHGIPMAVKDVVAVAEGLTTGNSEILRDGWWVGRDAPVVSRLKQAGAVITGKVATSEFAIGLPESEGSHPIPRNAWNLGHSPGGSSAGAANGVAAGLFLGAIGTDTGGSIRVPAAWNGVTGLMPTFGRVPKSGCIPFSFSLDHVGPLARSARDCAEILRVIAGWDASDDTSSNRPVEDYGRVLREDLTGLRIGVDRSSRFFPKGADSVLASSIEASIEVLCSLGATVVEVGLPYYEEVVAARWVMSVSEALAYHHGNISTRWSDYKRNTRLSIGSGAFATGADYVQAARVCKSAQRALASMFDNVDLIITPTAAVAAPALDSVGKLSLEEHFQTTFAAYWDAVGNPAIALPIGFNEAGLPLSMQIAGRPFDEGLLLGAGHAYQSATVWHTLPAGLLTSPRSSLPLRKTTRAPADEAHRDGGEIGEQFDSNHLDSLLHGLLVMSELSPGSDDLNALHDRYSQLRRMSASLYRLRSTVEESPALTFRVAPGISTR